MPIYPALYTEIHDGDDGTANSVNSRLSEISDAIGERGDGTVGLESPDIESFENSEHAHSDSESGGLIPFDNLDTSGASAGEKWVADGAGSGYWTSGYPFISAIVPMARISDVSNQWLRCDGRTIGNATSGGTARANADVEDLFTHLWSEFTNNELVIQDSSGTPTTRLGTAALDWADDKRMPLLDMRGRILGGMDDPTGAAAADVITDAEADVLGGTMGEEAHVLTLAEGPVGVFAATEFGVGDTYRTVGYSAEDGVGNNTVRGVGDAHNNVQPILFLNYFIYTGN